MYSKIISVQKLMFAVMFYQKIETYVRMYFPNFVTCDFIHRIPVGLFTIIITDNEPNNYCIYYFSSPFYYKLFNKLIFAP